MTKQGFLDKEKVPLYYLIIVSLWWFFYYKSNSQLNDFGEANFEFLYLIDGLLVLPVLCLWLIEDKKEAIFKALAFASLVILIAKFIVPEKNQVIIKELSLLKYAAGAILFFFEVSATLILFFAIKAAISKGDDPDVAIERPIKRLFGDNLIVRALSLEARVWTFVFFPRRIQTANYLGQYHFSYHKQGDAQTNSLGFIFLVLFELPIVHLLLHFLWSPTAAMIVSGLTLFGLFFLLAEYRAIGIRPVSIYNDKLLIRYGVWNTLELPLKDILSIQLNPEPAEKSKSVKIYGFSMSKRTNVLINLSTDDLDAVYLDLDQPSEFRRKLMLSIESYSGSEERTS